MTARALPQSPQPTKRKRVDDAVRAIYPRLTLEAHRLIRTRNVFDLEASDLCQEGVMRAVLWFEAAEDERWSDMEDTGVRALLYTVTLRAMHGRIVDHIRHADRLRRLRHLAPTVTEIDTSFADGQDARAALNHLMTRSSPPGRQVIAAAAEIGEVDIAYIIGRTGFSRGYVYKLLQRMTLREPVI